MKIIFSIKFHLPRIIFYTPFFFLTLFLTCAFSENENSINYYNDPQAILDRISKDGADKVARELGEDPEDFFNIWLWVMNKISSGEEMWLNVAVALKPGTDAALTETLFIALGEALVKAPNNVLTMFSDDFSIENICSFPDVSNPRFDTKIENLKELEKRKKSILSSSDKKIQSAQEQCLKCLEESRKEVSEWFDAQK